MIDYNNLNDLAIEFEKRRIYGDPRDFDLFEEKIDDEGNNCVVSKFSAYTYPDLIGDLENKTFLSVDSIKDAFREFIRYKVSHAPEMAIYERIDKNKHTFHDTKNSLLVSLSSYQKMLEGRKIEYFGTKDVYQADPKLTKLLNASNEKSAIIKQMNEGTFSQQRAVEKILPLQSQITDIESEFIKNHIESHIGKIKSTIEDNEIPQIPIKLHIVPSDGQRPYSALVTSGMSAYPMMAPSMAEPTTAELFMLLSPEWPLPPKISKKDKPYWPIEELLRLVKYVHGSRQWFSVGHTYGNGHPPKPFAKDTDLCAFLFKFPYKILTPTFCELMIGRKPVYFLQLMPIYRKEMDFLMSNSPEEFAALYKASRASEFTELERVNVCSGKKAGSGKKSAFCKNCGTVVKNIKPNETQFKCKQCGETNSIS